MLCVRACILSGKQKGGKEVHCCVCCVMIMGHKDVNIRETLRTELESTSQEFRTSPNVTSTNLVTMKT